MTRVDLLRPCWAQMGGVDSGVGASGVNFGDIVAGTASCGEGDCVRGVEGATGVSELGDWGALGLSSASQGAPWGATEGDRWTLFRRIVWVGVCTV